MGVTIFVSQTDKTGQLRQPLFPQLQSEQEVEPLRRTCQTAPSANPAHNVSESDNSIPNNPIFIRRKIRTDVHSRERKRLFPSPTRRLRKLSHLIESCTSPICTSQSPTSSNSAPCSQPLFQDRTIPTPLTRNQELGTRNQNPTGNNAPVRAPRFFRDTPSTHAVQKSFSEKPAPQTPRESHPCHTHVQVLTNACRPTLQPFDRPTYTRTPHPNAASNTPPPQPASRRGSYGR